MKLRLSLGTRSLGLYHFCVEMACSQNSKKASESSRESLDMCIVGITVKISDYVVDNVPLGHYQGVTGSVQEHLVTPS